MEYTRPLEKFERFNIYQRIKESTKESPIELFYHSKANVLTAGFGRTVMAERYKKNHFIDHLGTFNRDKVAYMDEDDNLITKGMTEDLLDNVLSKANNRLKLALN